MVSVYRLGRARWTITVHNLPFLKICRGHHHGSGGAARPEMLVATAKMKRLARGCSEGSGSPCSEGADQGVRREALCTSKQGSLLDGPAFQSLSDWQALNSNISAINLAVLGHLQECFCPSCMPCTACGR